MTEGASTSGVKEVRLRKEQFIILAVLLGHEPASDKKGFDLQADAMSTGWLPVIGLMDKLQEIGYRSNFVADIKEMQREGVIDVPQTQLGASAKVTELGKAFVSNWKNALPILFEFPHQWLAYKVK